jgi:tape measure domain-containing protein
VSEEVKIILKGEFKNKDAIVKALKQVDGNLKNISFQSKQTDKQVNNLSSSLKKLAQVAGLAFLTKKFFDLGKGSLIAAGNMEQFNVAFTTMLGSAEKARSLMAEIVEFTKKTPFELEGVVGSTKQLLAFGIAQEDIIPTLENLGNIASGVGVPVSRLTTVFGQVKAATRLMGQDLNQFIQAGVPLIGELSSMLGKTEAEIKDLVSEGAISFDMVKQALENMTGEGGKFFNLMDAQSKTFLGTLSNAADGFNLVKVALGNALFPVAKTVLNFIVKTLDTLRESIDNNSKQITNFAQSALNALTTLWKVALKPLISGIGFFISGIKAIINLPFAKWIGAATAAIFALNGAIKVLIASNPLLLAITAIITAIGVLSEKFNSLPNFIQIALLSGKKILLEFELAVNDVIQSIFDKLGLLANFPGFGWVDEAKNKFTSLKDSVSKDIDDINTKIQSLQEGGTIQQVLMPTQEGEEPEALQQPIEQMAEAVETKGESPEDKLQKAKDLNDALLANEQAFLDGRSQARNEADQLDLDNELLNNEQKILNEEGFRTRQQELQQKYLDGKIETQEFERELDILHDEAKILALEERIDQEQEKESANVDTLITLKKKLEKERENQTKKRNVFEKIMENEHLKNAQTAANQLVQLQNSKHKSLARIGKAAAIFQITTDTATGAISAYKSLASIPFVGPALGAAAAGAVIAFGAERLSEATSASFAVGAAEIPQDMQANIHRGEMIIPATFAESIRAGELALSSGDSSAGLADAAREESSPISININFEGAEFIGDISDEMIEHIGIRMAELIEENIIPSIPTRNAI